MDTQKKKFIATCRDVVAGTVGRVHPPFGEITPSADRERREEDITTQINTDLHRFLKRSFFTTKEKKDTKNF